MVFLATGRVVEVERESRRQTHAIGRIDAREARPEAEVVVVGALSPIWTEYGQTRTAISDATLTLVDTKPKLGGLGPPDRVPTASQAPLPGDPIRRALVAVMASGRREEIERDLVEALGPVIDRSSQSDSLPL